MVPIEGIAPHTRIFSHFLRISGVVNQSLASACQPLTRHIEASAFSTGAGWPEAMATLLRSLSSKCRCSRIATRWRRGHWKTRVRSEDEPLRDSAVGARMYSRLYWAYALLEGDDIDIFTDGMANWPRMSEGFDLLLKQYPDSDYLMNGHAYMACRAGDSDKYPIQGRTGTLRFTGWKNYASARAQISLSTEVSIPTAPAARFDRCRLPRALPFPVSE